jgi:hypothetical protein
MAFFDGIAIGFVDIGADVDAMSDNGHGAIRRSPVYQFGFLLVFQRHVGQAISSLLTVCRNLCFPDVFGYEDFWECLDLRQTSRIFRENIGTAYIY